MYDDSTAWGWIGESYAMQVANLVGRFGTRQAVPTRSYRAGMVSEHTATIYVGAIYDEPLPSAFLDDVSSTTKPVVWLFNNIWQLGAWNDAFAAEYGFRLVGNDAREVTSVSYKGQSLVRHPSAGETMRTAVTDATKAAVLATANLADGDQHPWALRSKQLTYVADIPLSYVSENDRYLILADLLFDALAPTTATRRRALVRLEDVGPTDNPKYLTDAVDYLAAAKVPFSFGVYPRYVDSNGEYNNGVPLTVPLKDRPEMVAAIKYAISKGGTMLMHGWTHQYSNKANPYGGTSGDDFEFYLAHEEPETNRVIYDGPVPEDSTEWALNRVDGSAADFRDAGLPVPTIFEFPHYAGSDVDYRAIGTRFNTRYERSLYPKGTLSGTPVDHQFITGQFFPYPVRDLYGTKVVPENLGNYAPEPYNTHPARLPHEIVATAQRNLVVRDGFASFFYHPYLGVSGLQEIVEGIKGLGYSFVSAPSV